MENLQLSSGEKAALAQGKDLITEPQMAVCYTVAYYANIGSKVYFGANLNHDDLSVDSGMHPETYRRTVNKFGLRFNDQHEDEEFVKSEIVYEKILNHYEKFQKQKIEDILNFAKTAFTPEAREIGQMLKDKFLQDRKKHADKAALKKKQFDESIKFKVQSLYNSLKTKFDHKKAKKMALDKIAAEMKTDFKEVEKVFKAVFS